METAPGAWWAFGADGYIRTGWVYDYSAGEWYYVDENTGMRTGWYLDPQDGRWYYLDPATGEMLTEWQLIPDLGYVYLNPYAPQPTWTYDEELKIWGLHGRAQGVHTAPFIWLSGHRTAIM